MPWTIFVIEVDEAGADAVTAHLAQRGAAVEVRDADTVERPAAGRVELRLYVTPERAADDEAVLRALLAELAGRLPAVAGWTMSALLLEDESWRDAWKRFFRAQRVGRFLVRPSWDPVAPGADERVIDLDPGRAFGTGAHASTRLCLRALERLEAVGFAPRRIVDAGCGSGILSIAALRVFPAASVLALDQDPEAVATARENVQRNGLLERVEFREADAAAVAPGGADLVLANIQREVLEAVAGELAGALVTGGALVLSGLLTEQALTVTGAYTAQELAVTDVLDEDEWRAVVLRRV